MKTQEIPRLILNDYLTTETAFLKTEAQFFLFTGSKTVAK